MHLGHVASVFQQLIVLPHYGIHSKCLQILPGVPLENKVCKGGALLTMQRGDTGKPERMRKNREGEARQRPLHRQGHDGLPEFQGTRCMSDTHN